MMRRKQLRESRRQPPTGRRPAAGQVQGPHVRTDSVSLPGGARPRPVPPTVTNA
jgi:hypothetical protein